MHPPLLQSARLVSNHCSGLAIYSMVQWHFITITVIALHPPLRGACMRPRQALAHTVSAFTITRTDCTCFVLAHSGRCDLALHSCPPSWPDARLLVSCAVWLTRCRHPTVDGPMSNLVLQIVMHDIVMHDSLLTCAMSFSASAEGCCLGSGNACRSALPELQQRVQTRAAFSLAAAADARSLHSSSRHTELDQALTSSFCCRGPPEMGCQLSACSW